MILESFIQSQKHQVAEELRRKFRRYITEATPTSDQFMVLLEKLFRDKTEQMQLIRPRMPAPEISEVFIEMADVVQQIERADLTLDEAYSFMRTTHFTQNFRVDGERIFRRTQQVDFKRRPSTGFHAIL